MRIALNDGFSGQTVEITVDGAGVNNRSGVRTDRTVTCANAVGVGHAALRAGPVPYGGPLTAVNRGRAPEGRKNRPHAVLYVACLTA